MRWKELTPIGNLSSFLALAKEQCGIPSADTSRDATTGLYVRTAARAVERYTRRAMIQRQFLGVMDEFPETQQLYADDYIQLPVGPMVSFDSFQYVDQVTGSLLTWPTTNYSVSVVGPLGRIKRGLGIPWPIPKFGIVDRIQVTWTAGFGTDLSNAPEPMQAVVLLMVRNLVDNPTPVNAGTMVEVPLGYRHMLDLYKIRTP